MSNSAKVVYTKISPNSTNPRREKISKITIHHMAGNLTVETLGRVFASPSRRASSNYGVGADGRVGMYVEEKNRAWTSGNSENDHKAVTIEVANCGGSPDWPVSDKAIEATIDLCVDICRRNGIKKLNFTGDKTGNLTMHKWFQPTTCPGPSLEGKFPYIAAEVNKRLEKTDPVAPAPKPKESTGVLYRVQVGAFRNKVNAEDLVKRLKSAGFDAHIKTEIEVKTPAPAAEPKPDPAQTIKEDKEVDYSTKGGLTLKLTKGDIEKIEYIHARQPTESIRSAHARTGADITINANFFEMSSGKTQGHVTDEGKIISQNMSPYGYAFVDKKWPVFSYANQVKAVDFVGGYPTLLRSGQIAIDSNDPAFSAKSTTRRGRTAMGSSEDKIVIRVIPDTGAFPRKTILELASELKALGCTDAVNYDGGGSSQFISPWGEFVSGRNVDGFICIWLRKSSKQKSTPEKGAENKDIIHVVKRGETLGSIGKKYGVPYTKIAKDNGIKNPSVIRVGQRLVIKK